MSLRQPQPQPAGVYQIGELWTLSWVIGTSSVLRPAYFGNSSVMLRRRPQSGAVFGPAAHQRGPA